MGEARLSQSTFSVHLLGASIGPRRTLDRLAAPLVHASTSVDQRPLVCASDNESLPRVILEAMAFELLVVSTDIFGIPEVIQDGVTGFLCCSRDEYEMSEQLSAALAMRPEHREIRSATAEHVRQRHDAAVYAAAFRDLIDTTVNERPAVRSLTP